MAMAALRTRPAPTVSVSVKVPPQLPQTARRSLEPAHPSAQPSQAIQRSLASTSAQVKAIAPTRIPMPPSLLVSSPVGPPITLRDPRAAKDPHFQKVMGELEKSAARVKMHPTPRRKAAEAQAAVQPDIEKERLAGAQAHQANMMQSEAQAEKNKKVEANEDFLKVLQERIKTIMPKTFADTESIMEGDKPQKLKDAMTGNIQQQKEKVYEGIKATSHESPDPSKVDKKVVIPLPIEGIPPPLAVGAAEAIPGPKPETEVSLEQSKQDANQRLKDAKLTPGQLQEANDPRFSAVLIAKSDVEKHADSAPKQFRTLEQKILTQAVTRAVGDEKQGLAAFQREKSKSGVAVRLKQRNAQHKDEAGREEVVKQIEGIYSETTKRVKTVLFILEVLVPIMFDIGITAAMTDMKKSVKRDIDAYKKRRYSGLGGPFLRVKDWATELPEKANIYYRKGHERFIQNLNELVVTIATFVERGLKIARKEIADGQRSIKVYVQGLHKDLQGFGKTAEREVAGRFEDLNSQIDSQKTALAQKLTQRYKEADDDANAQLEEIKEENKGLLSKLEDFIDVVADYLQKFKDKIWPIIKKGIEIITRIVFHPIRFLKNLLKAIGRGLDQFGKNLLTNLQDGVRRWLFDSLAEARIEVPKDFEPSSILKLVLSILGLDYVRIRAKAAAQVGEKNIERLEAAGKLLWTLATNSPEELWKMMEEHLSNLKDMVFDKLKEWAMTKLIEVGLQMLATMFTPVGAIVQAVITIYNAIMYFIEHRDEIVELVQSIIDAIVKIADGDVDDAAGYIVKALKNSIPLILGFLARLLKLGSISSAVKGVIHGIQGAVGTAVEKVIAKIVAGGGKLLGKGKEVVGKLVNWWKARKDFKAEDGTKHALYFDGEEGSAVLMIASDKKAVKEFLQNIDVQGKPRKENSKKEAQKIVKSIDDLKGKRDTGTKSEDTEKCLDQLDDPMKVLVGESTKSEDDLITTSPVSYNTLSTIAKSLHDRWSPPHGAPKHFRNKAGGHVWVRLKSSTKTKNFGATAPLRSGEGGGEAFRQAVNAKLGENGLTTITFIPTGGPKGINNHTETMVANVARTIKLLNKKKVESVEIKVFSFLEVCDDCETLAKDLNHVFKSQKAKRGIVFNAKEPPPGHVAKNDPNYDSAKRLVDSAEGDMVWFNFTIDKP